MYYRNGLKIENLMQRYECWKKNLLWKTTVKKMEQSPKILQQVSFLVQGSERKDFLQNFCYREKRFSQYRRQIGEGDEFIFEKSCKCLLWQKTFSSLGFWPDVSYLNCSEGQTAFLILYLLSNKHFIAILLFSSFLLRRFKFFHLTATWSQHAFLFIQRLTDYLFDLSIHDNMVPFISDWKKYGTYRDAASSFFFSVLNILR